MAKNRQDKIELPWLKFYHKDWQSSIRVAKLSVPARYCYLELLLYCFGNGGFRDSLEDIRYICRVKTTKHLDKWWREIQEQGFFQYEDGLWRNAKMDSIRGDAEDRWGQKVLDGQIVPIAPTLGMISLPTLGMVSDETQTGLGGNSVGSQADLNGISAKVNIPEFNTHTMQIREDSLEKEQVSNRVKEAANPEGPAAPATTRVDTDPATNEAKRSPAGCCATPDTSDFPSWTVWQGQENEVKFDRPIPLETLVTTTEFLEWHEMRLATMSPTASEVEVRFSNPWMNPQWYGNLQNMWVALADQHNLLCKMPGRKDTILNTQGYHRAIKGLVRREANGHYWHNTDLKIQIALHYLSYNLKPFKLSFPDYLGEFTVNHLQEHCAKGLDRNAWGKGKPGIPVILPVEIEPEEWDWLPALVWSIRRTDDNHTPVYVLLDKTGKPISDHYTEVEDWVWDEGYEWPWKGKDKKSDDW